MKLPLCIAALAVLSIAKRSSKRLSSKKVEESRSPATTMSDMVPCQKKTNYSMSSSLRLPRLGLFEEKGLVNATVSVTISGVYPDGSYEEPRSYAMPIKTTVGYGGQLVIRDSNGTQVDYLPSSGDSEVLFIFQILAMFVRSGMWTLEVDARLGDENNPCLFAVSMTQWLEGRL